MITVKSKQGIATDEINGEWYLGPRWDQILEQTALVSIKPSLRDSVAVHPSPWTGYEEAIAWQLGTP